MELSSPTRTCPQCGQPLPPGREACANCGRDEANPFTAPAAPAIEPKPREIDLDLWFALIVAIVACVAVGIAVPGLGVLLGMVFVPAVVRAAAVMKRKAKAAGAKSTAGQMTSAVLASAGVSIAVWLASAIAFAAVCTPVSFLFIFIGRDSIVSVVAVFGLSGLAGLASFFWLMKRYWPRAVEDD